METLTIGQLAKDAGVNIETIRYYERRGLIPEPPRRKSGYRQYGSDFVLRIQFIKRAQELGFSLNEIDELLALRVDSGTACSEVKHHAEAKIADIEGKIKTLQITELQYNYCLTKNQQLFLIFHTYFFDF